MSSLIAGINGGTTIRVFSSDLPGTFSVARAIPATGILITEPPVPTLSRQTEDQVSYNQYSCLGPIIDIGSKLEATKNKLIPIVTWFLDLFPFIARLFAEISSLRSKIIKKLGLACLLPKLLKPVHPFIKRVKCILGLDNKGLVETQQRSDNLCSNPVIYDRKINLDQRFTNQDFRAQDTGNRVDECFEEMETETYGARVILRLVDDQPCDDPRFKSICRETISRGHVIFESDCQTPM